MTQMTSAFRSARRTFKSVGGDGGSVTARVAGPMMRFQLTINGVREVDRMLSAKADAVDDFRPAWEGITDAFIKHEEEVFEKDGAVGEWEVWKPLNPAYAKWKESRGFSPNILRKTGNLESSLTQKAASDFVFHSGRKFMEIGSKDPKIRIHTDGGPDGVPAKREPIRVTDELRRNWMKVIQRHVMQAGSTERYYVGR
jgi:hypothetical protein